MTDAAVERDTTDEGPMPYVCEPFFKARAATEGDDRFLYCEPSSGQWDLQGERTLAKALVDSAEYFLKFGAIDIGHFSMPHPKLRRIAREYGFDQPDLAKVGIPLEVRQNGEGQVVVKAQLYRGDTKAAEQANLLWEQLLVGGRYYPSIGGTPLAKSCLRGNTQCTITAARWSNIGLWQEPVDVMVKAVSIMPMSAFAKALIAGGGTDVATLDGGATLRRESLGDDPAYWRAATSYLRGAECPHRGLDPSHDMLKAHFRDCGGFDQDAAANAADRLLWELNELLATRDTNRAALAA